MTELTDEQIAREERFLEGIPRLNIGALFLPPIWGPAHGMWATILFYPIWLFADNTFYAYQSFDPATATVTPIDGGYEYSNAVSILDGNGAEAVTNVVLTCDADGNCTSMSVDGALVF